MKKPRSKNKKRDIKWIKKIKIIDDQFMSSNIPITGVAEKENRKNRKKKLPMKDIFKANLASKNEDFLILRAHQMFYPVNENGPRP